MAMTQQEILEARAKLGIPPEGLGSGGSTTGASTGGNRSQEFRARLEARKQAKAAAIPRPERFKASGIFGGLQDVAHGAVERGTKTILDVGHIGQKIQGVVGAGLDKVTGDKYDFSGDAKEGVFAPESAAGQEIRRDLEPKNLGEKIGGGIEAVAELAVPVGGAPAKTVLGKIGQGAAIGGTMGVAQGVADDESAGQVAKDAAIGAAAGGALGLAGGAIGKFKAPPDLEKKLEFITPTATDLNKKEFTNLLNRGRIKPGSLLKPDQYVLSDSEKAIATKYADVIDKKPTKTAINISNKLGTLDDEVGNFLRENNGIYNKGELKNHLQDVMADIDDITLPEDRVTKAKDNIITNFVNAVDKNNMEGLWQARKEFDQRIESAFSGSPTLQKEIKRALRNAVQDFIADRTPNNTYKEYMGDMTKLFHLQDVVDVKAFKARGLDELAEWAKSNPRAAKAIGFSLGALGLYGLGSAGVSAAGSASN